MEQAPLGLPGPNLNFHLFFSANEVIVAAQPMSAQLVPSIAGCNSSAFASFIDSMLQIVPSARNPNEFCPLATAFNQSWFVPTCSGIVANEFCRTPFLPHRHSEPSGNRKNTPRGPARKICNGALLCVNVIAADRDGGNSRGSPSRQQTRSRHDHDETAVIPPEFTLRAQAPDFAPCAKERMCQPD